MIRRILILLGLVALFDPTLFGQETNPVKTEIETEEAWMGQAVKVVVTLMSPGPFSGTAVFQIPEIPQSLVVKLGGPQVGSETVSGESMITQRHEFHVYTQKVGTVEIPAFPVKFESKETFIGDPLPRSGSTTAVTFQSKRPPGTEGFSYVVSSSTLTVKESWSPPDQAEFDAGDILSRSITREASDVSAMFLMPFASGPIDGVRIYPSEPEVIDTRERGVASAVRVDTIKYQFARGGTFTIPEIATAWWNPETEKVELVKLEGLTVSVKAPPVPPAPRDWRRMIAIMLFGFIAGHLLKRPVFDPLDRRYKAWKARRNAPEAVAARALIRACRSNEPKKAYTELMVWRRAVGVRSEFTEKLQDPAGELSRFLFSRETPERRWDGTPLLMAFRDELHRRQRQPDREQEKEALPPLNPRVI